MSKPRKEAEKRLLKASCRRFPSGHRPSSMPDRLRCLADLAPYEPPDEYGAGAVIERLERRVADLLGTERAVFEPKGVIAQQAAPRVWSKRVNHLALVVHPKSHLDLDEEAAYERLHPFRLIPGAAPTTCRSPWPTSRTSASPSSPSRSSCPCGAPASACPRGQSSLHSLPGAHDSGVAFHLDSARLWEAQSFYGRSLAETETSPTRSTSPSTRAWAA